MIKLISNIIFNKLMSSFYLKDNDRYIYKK